MKYLPVWLIGFTLLACETSQKTNDKNIDTPQNPHAEGFDLSGSDENAIAIADSVMIAMGGRNAWDNTKILQWNFFNSRKHTWNKATGWAKVESLRTDLQILVNVQSDSLYGQVKKDGELLSHPDSLKKYLQHGKSAWINDAYWLFMPFKLKDSGVTLTYEGSDTTQNGELSDKLKLTFKEVGDTPDNAYDVWVSKKDKLIKQWAYYAKNDQDSSNFVTPWDNYQSYNGILLADNRGKRKITEIQVLDSVNVKTFTEL